jgi:5,10-methylenetetrahydromethanopterin reductase
VTLARRAEEAGFDVVSVYHDLLFQPAIFPLVTIAAATERVRLGPAALNPSTLHPVELAGQAAALDIASGGRAYLGLVTGAWLDRLGLDERAPVARMREAVEIVRRLHAGDRSGFTGSHFSLAEGAGLNYEPERQRIPLMIGTWKPRMAALAGEVADEVKIGGSANADLVEVMRRWIGNDDVGIVVGAVTVVDEDGDAARERARQEVEMYMEVVGEMDATIEGTPPLDRVKYAGTPEDVAEHARRVYEAGATRVEFGTPQGLTSMQGLALLCDRVLPLLREYGSIR